MEKADQLVPVEQKLPQIQDWKTKAAALLKLSQDFDVTSDAQASEAASKAKEAKNLRLQIDQARDQAVRPLNEMVGQVNDLCRQPIADLKLAENALKKRAARWAADQREKQERERRRLQAEADEKRRQAEEIERKRRQEAEELERRQQQATTDEEAEEARVDAELAKLEAAEQSSALRKQAAEVDEAADDIVPVKTTPRGFGTVAPRKVWKAEVVDPAAIPREYLTIDWTTIRAAARIKPRPPEIPGIQWTHDVEGTLR